MTDAQFLFLNYSSNEVPRSLHRSAYYVHSHIQKHQLKFIGRHKKSVASSARALVGWQRTRRQRASTVDIQNSSLSDSSSFGLGEPSCSSCRPTIANEARNHVAHVLHGAQTPSQLIHPTTALDSYAHPILSDNKLRRILHYYDTVWTQGRKFISAEFHLGGFSVHAYDATISPNSLQEFLHGPGSLHVNALLAATVGRMRFVNGLRLEKGTEPELLNAKAIRSLRHYLSVRTNRLEDDRFVLDLSYLILAEIYSGENTVGPSVYWDLTREYIMARGGLQNMDPFVANHIVSVDLVISESRVIAPALDVLKFPKLLGVTGPLPNSEQLFTPTCPVLRILRTSYPLLRCSVYQALIFTSVLQHIHRLRGSAATSTIAYVRANLKSVYTFLIHSAFPQMGTTARVSTPFGQLQAADIFNAIARETSYAIWLWQVAVSFAPPRQSSSAPPQDAKGSWSYLAQLLPTLPSGAALFFLDAGRHIFRALTAAEHHFAQQTEWRLPEAVRLWISALGVTTAETTEVKGLFREHFRDLCRSLGLASSTALQEMLANQIPLERVDGFGWDELAVLL